jgi:hypothetical protein
MNARPRWKDSHVDEKYLHVWVAITHCNVSMSERSQGWMLLGARCSKIVRFTDPDVSVFTQRATTLLSAQLRQKDSYIHEGQRF